MPLFVKADILPVLDVNNYLAAQAQQTRPLRPRARRRAMEPRAY